MRGYLGGSLRGRKYQSHVADRNALPKRKGRLVNSDALFSFYGTFANQKLTMPPCLRRGKISVVQGAENFWR
jgi:hypothetical protein